MARLTVLGVRSARPGRHCDGLGLYLVVKPSGARSWLLRIQQRGKRRDIGLGGVDLTPRATHARIHDLDLLRCRVLSLAQARDKCAILRKLARSGLDPVVERDRRSRFIPTFAEAVEHAHEEFSKGWTPKHAAAFKTSLITHAVPHFGTARVDEIDLAMITSTLAVIWNDKPAIAQKLRVRINQVLSFCQAHSWRTAEAPSAHAVRKGLARPARPRHFAALPYQAVPDFLAGLSALPDTPGRLALAFAILTAARSGEVRQARWQNIDLAAQTWLRPATIMKMGDAHTIPLSRPALAILERARRFQGGCDLLFPGMQGRPLSDMTLTKALRNAGGEGATVHGFRSSFRDWAAEVMPHVPAIVPEMALAHKIRDATEGAYLRSDLLELRRDLMRAWGEYAHAF